VPSTRDQNRVIAKKLRDLEIYNAKLKERGLEEDKPIELLPVLSADKAQQLAIFLKNIGKECKAERHVFWSWSWFRSRIGPDWGYI